MLILLLLYSYRNACSKCNNKICLESFLMINIFIITLPIEDEIRSWKSFKKSDWRKIQNIRCVRVFKTLLLYFYVSCIKRKTYHTENNCSGRRIHWIKCINGDNVNALLGMPGTRSNSDNNGTVIILFYKHILYFICISCYLLLNLPKR